LVSAFAKVVKSLGYRKPREIVYDDTPIEEVAGEMLETIARAGSVLFADLFRRDLAKLHLITSFLALLELLRQRCVRTEPAEADDIRIVFVPENQRGDVPARAEAHRPARKFKPAKSGTDPELKNILEDLAATQSTEFDEALKAIKVPDVILEHPVDETEDETDDADEGDDEPPTTSNRETETPHE
ncbi:MAG: hypothetical protein QGD94_12895, partial [Planctomycetia bacterium]|nr:hypothetical protein [Planctomycetia bacterium]